MTQRPKKSWPELLKLLTILATIIGSAVGSYKAAQYQARASANVSYEVMKEAIDGLKQNQKMMWDVVMKAPAPATKSMSYSYGERPDSKPIFVITPTLSKTLDEAVAKKAK